MPATNETIDSTPNPQAVTVVMAVIRAVLIALGAVGVTVSLDSNTAMLLASAIVTIGGVVWQLWEQWRQARMRHDAAVASAKGAKAIQHRDYSNA